MHLPLCTNCNGHGNDGAGVCPICKGGGRKALTENAPVGEWVRWIREQPDNATATAVMEQYLATLAPAKTEATGKGKGKKDDE